MPEHQQIQQSKKPDTSFQKQATLVIQTPLSNPYSIIQRAKINPKSLTHADIMQLQRTIGNRAVGKLLSSIGNTSTDQQVTVQRQEIPEEEEPLQGKMIETIQRQEVPEEEEPLQGKMIETIQRQEIPEEEEPLQGKMIKTIQRQGIPEEEEPLQGKMAETIQRQESPEEKETCPSCVQRQEIPEEEEPLQGKMIDPVQRQEIPEDKEPLQGKKIGTIQKQEISEEEEPLQTKRENNTGMPDNLKAGVESLSGIDMSDVKVHYNSNKPAEVGALAYTQGTDIHVAPGQERHLGHEAWHAVQQMQGRVNPTMQLKDGVAVNDDVRLEQEADLMGENALVNAVQLKGEQEKLERLQSTFLLAQRMELGQGELHKAPLAPIWSDSVNVVSYRQQHEARTGVIQHKLLLDGVGQYNSEKDLKDVIDSDPKLVKLKNDPIRSRALALARAEALYKFNSPNALATTLKTWSSPTLDEIPRDFDDYIVGFLEREVDSRVEERKRELHRTIESKKRPWESCGSTAGQIITSLHDLGAQISEDREQVFAGKEGRKALASLMTEDVPMTTLLDCWIDGIHEWTLDKQPGVGTILSQGFLGKYSAFWWAGLDPNGPIDDKLLYEMRAKFGNGQIINVAEFVRVVGEFQDSDKWSNPAHIPTWEKLPMSPSYSAPKVRNDNELIEVKCVKRVVKNAPEIFGRLHGDPRQNFLSQLVLTADWGELTRAQKELLDTR